MSSLTSLRRPAAVLLLALSLPALSACSGSDSPPAASPSASSPSPAAPATSAAPSASPSASPSSDPTTPEPARETEKASGSAADKAYCKTFKAVSKKLDQIPKDKTATSQKAALKAISEVEAAAPDAVKKDWTEFTGLFKKATEGDKDVIKKSQAKISSLGERIDKDAVKRCGSKIG